MPLQFDIETSSPVNIKVIGVGGGGNNAVNRMIGAGVSNVEFISVNTDMQALSASRATTKLQIGDKLTKGRGAGGNPERGQRAAEESKDEIANFLKGTEMIFITAGMGGGTGTGAAPVIAEIAREMGILTVGIVTKPFNFEGRRKMQQAEMGISNLKENCDSLVVIPNERLKLISETQLTMLNAFEIADEALRKGISGISELITSEGLINLDFADISAVMKDAGYAHMGYGTASGRDMVEEAAKLAITSPLIETSINGAKGVIVNIVASPNVNLDEIDKACTMIQQAVDKDADIKVGMSFDTSMNDEVKITVIATGFNSISSNIVRNDDDSLDLSGFSFMNKSHAETPEAESAPDAAPAAPSSSSASIFEVPLRTGGYKAPDQGRPMPSYGIPSSIKTNTYQAPSDKPVGGDVDDIDVVLDIFKKK